MIVHTVKIGEKEGPVSVDHHRMIYVGGAQADLKHMNLLVYGRHRWEFYIKGTLDFLTCSRTGLDIKQWKTATEHKICQAHGVMLLVSNSTAEDEGALWEIDTALTHHVPIVGVDIRSRPEGEVPDKLAGKMTRYGWEWFAQFINNI